MLSLLLRVRQLTLYSLISDIIRDVLDVSVGEYPFSFFSLLAFACLSDLKRRVAASHEYHRIQLLDPSIRLRSNYIDNDGAAAIAEALRYNQTLTTLE